MRSRTDSESAPTSTPSTRAEPPLSGRRPVSILMTVVFPLPLGPRKPKISPFSTRKLTSLTAVKLPKRRTRCSAEIAGSTGDCCALAIVSLRRFELYLGGHAGEDAASRVVDANFHAEDLVDAFLPRLHVAREKFGLLVNLFHLPAKNGVGKGVDADFRPLAELNAAKLGFRNVNADIDLVLLKERGDRSVRGDEIARANIQNFNDRWARRNDLALAESGEVIRIRGIGQIDIFTACSELLYNLLSTGWM